jgi:predicted ATPase
VKMKKAVVKNYKSVEDSGEFSIDQITCLVGKNEAGKSAILDALYKLNPVEPNRGEFTEYEFPRRRIKRDFTGDEWKQEPAIATTWILDKADRDAAIEEFGFDPFLEEEVTISKGYDNVRRHGLKFNELAAVKHYTHKLSKAELEPVGDSLSVVRVVEQLGKVESPTANQTAVLDALKENFSPKDLTAKVRAFVVTRIPKMVKFSEYYRLPGRIAINDLRQKISQNTTSFNERVFLALLDLAGTNIDALTTVQQTEQLYMQMEAISNQLTDEIFEYWSTNAHLSVKFDIREGKPGDAAPFNSGLVFHTRVENQRHRATVDFDERSSGFIWFFSFLVWFSQVKKNYGQNLMLLLDEPGVSLHGKAQADLLRYFNEKLRTKYQMIYTTHSPFMVDSDYLLSVRTVEDRMSGKTILGTKVEGHSLTVERDTILPILGALGIDITQTLFVGKHTILVEGPSDLLYLKWFSHVLRTSGRTGLDPRWTISPVGGIKKIASYATLFSTQQLNIAVFSDFHVGDKTEIERLRKGDLLKKGQVLTAETYAAKPEADIEDMIGYPMYALLVNRTYDLKSGQALAEPATVQSVGRVLEEVERHFRILPPQAAEFDHFAPAAFLMENGSSFKGRPELEQALGRFEKLFSDFNAMLPAKRD